MDEFNQLKKMWNRSYGQNPEGPGREEIMRMLRAKSSGPADKLKRSLRIEIGAILMAIPLLVAIMFRMPEPYFIFNTGILILAFTGSLVYYYRNLRLLTNIWNKSQDNIRNSIESTLMLFRFFRKIYFWLNIVLFPFGVYFGYIIGFGLGSGGRKATFFDIPDSLPQLLVWLGGFLIVALLFGVFWLFLRFYVRKLYDVHIRKLEEILKELLENEEE